MADGKALSISLDRSLGAYLVLRDGFDLKDKESGPTASAELLGYIEACGLRKMVEVRHYFTFTMDHVRIKVQSLEEVP
jgi:hypothetical protein